MSNSKKIVTTKKIATIKEVAEIIDAKLQVTYDEITVERNLSPKPQFTLEYDDEGFTLFLTHGEDKQTSQDITVSFSADVFSREYSEYLTIVELKNIKLAAVEIDSYEVGIFELDVADAKPLLEIAETIVSSANFYRLVDSSVYTTSDLNETYSDMSEEYDRYYR